LRDRSRSAHRAARGVGLFEQGDELSPPLGSHRRFGMPNEVDAVQVKDDVDGIGVIPVP